MTLQCHASWPVPNLPAPSAPNLQSYDTSDPDVVFDRVTKLSWQRKVDQESYVFRRAQSYCDTLAIGGHHDWRVPSMVELASISDTSRAEPAADPVAFPNTPPVPFWTAQTDVTNTGLGWYVFFKSGGIFVGNDVIDPARVRCVRGVRSCGDVYAKPYSSAGVITRDRSTGIAWQREVDHDNFAWEDASRHCASLALDGGGWRLPSLRELLTLVDAAHVEPAIDVAAFPTTPSEFFWSSSPSRAPAGTAWGVNFTRGSSGAASVNTRAHVRCAR